MVGRGVHVSAGLTAQFQLILSFLFWGKTGAVGFVLLL